MDTGMPGEFFFTGVLSLEADGTGTKYRALVIHGDEEACRKHKSMGFEEGWGKDLDQRDIERRSGARLTRTPIRGEERLIEPGDFRTAAGLVDHIQHTRVLNSRV